MGINFRENVNDFKENGCTVIKNFLAPPEVEEMIQECARIINGMDVSKERTVFKTGKAQVASDYFLKSSDKISFFFEEAALNEIGDLIVEKSKSLNKIGHALHWLSPVFKKVTFSEKIKDVLLELEYQDPVVVQSMFIFKHPKVGGEVVPHQDSTYLYTEPLSTMGIWFPLVDVTEENGCLFFVPGSHKDPIYQRFGRVEEESTPLLLKGDPAPYKDDDYKPILAEKGDCVLIHGSVVHKSGRNYSSSSRPVYTFHVVEQKDTDYSNQNWLQPSSSLPFPSVYSNVK